MIQSTVAYKPGNKHTQGNELWRFRLKIANTGMRYNNDS